MSDPFYYLRPCLEDIKSSLERLRDSLKQSSYADDIATISSIIELIDMIINPSEKQQNDDFTKYKEQQRKNSEATSPVQRLIEAFKDIGNFSGH